MMGFRKKSSGSPSKTNSRHGSTIFLKELATSTDQKGKIGPDAYVSGFSFQGTYVVESDEE